MSDRRIIPHCAWAMKQCRERKLPPDVSWLIVSIAERVHRSTLQWTSSVAAMVADTRFSRRTVLRLIPKLPEDLIEKRHGTNKRWVFTLLRPAVETLDTEDLELPSGANLTPPDPPSGANLTPYPLKKESPEGKEESAAPSAPPAPAPLRDEEVALKEAEAPKPKRPRRMPLPDDWAPSQEERQLCIEAGLNPDNVREELSDWARATGAQSADWHATTRNWIRREKKLYGPKSSNRRGRASTSDLETVRARQAARRGQHYEPAFAGVTIEGAVA